jgi:hypothetical protein
VGFHSSLSGGSFVACPAVLARNTRYSESQCCAIPLGEKAAVGMVRPCGFTLLFAPFSTRASLTSRKQRKIGLENTQKRPFWSLSRVVKRSPSRCLDCHSQIRQTRPKLLG